MKTVAKTCEVCGTHFDRSYYEDKRNQKLGRKTYCSLSCAGKVTYKNCPPQPKGVIPTSLIGKAGNGLDEFSPFRRYLKTARNRKVSRRKQIEITLSDLKDQWEGQNGTCPYTGWHLDNPPVSYNQEETWHLRRASLDRIDSSKGYIKGNIQFVSMIAQFAKNSFTEEQLFEFCEQVVTHRGKIPASSPNT